MKDRILSQQRRCPGSASRVLPIGLVLIMLATASAPAAAQSLPGELDPAAARAVHKSCQADYHAYCTGENPTASAEIACLRQHYLNLSHACRSAVQGAKGKES